LNYIFYGGRKVKLVVNTQGRKITLPYPVASLPSLAELSKPR
jgi:hypothetical protein